MLNCKPFGASPNPQFFYLNTPLKKIVTAINKNFSEPMGVIVLTGDAGTGKTTFLNHLKTQFRLLSFSQPMSSAKEMFLAIKETLEIHSDSTDTHNLDNLDNLVARHLKSLPEKKRYDALVFDEAQSCSEDMLIGLGRLQSAVVNFGGKLPVILSGHEELVSKISKLKFRSAMENHIFSYKIENLNFQDMQSMINYRLKISGSSILDIFSLGAIEEVYIHSNGVSIIVNNICDLALMIAFGKKQNIISSDTILSAARNVLNFQKGSPLSSSSEPILETEESKKTTPSSLQPDHKISDNSNVEKPLEKRTFPSKIFKVAALAGFVLLVVGLGNHFLYKRISVNNDNELSLSVHRIPINRPVEKDFPLEIGYPPKSMETDPILDEAIENSDVEKENAYDIALNRQYEQNQTIQNRTAPEQVIAEPKMPEQLIPEQISQNNTVQEEKKALDFVSVSKPVDALPKSPSLNSKISDKTETLRSSFASTPKVLATKKKESKNTSAPVSIKLKPNKLKDMPKPQFNRALSVAVQKNNTALVNQLLAQGVDPDSTDESGSPLLLKAAEMGYLKIFNALLKNGADINANNRDGDTPLMKAAWKGSSHVVSLLLENNADINRQNMDGFSALFYSAINGHGKVVESLLDHGVLVDLADINKKTPLMAAAWNGHIKIVNLLLEHDSNVDKKDKNSWTALMFAAFPGHQEIFRRLIVAGSNMAIKNSEGYTAEMLAIAQGHGTLAHHISN